MTTIRSIGKAVCLCILGGNLIWKASAQPFEPPLMSLSERQVQTNGATFFPDRSAVPGSPGPLNQPDSPDATTGFLAMSDQNTVIVPDTHGAVGTNYVMTMLNAGVRIQTRSGTVVYTNTLKGFWTNWQTLPMLPPCLILE